MGFALYAPRSTLPMKALVKKESRPGLWLQEVPEPVVGINDVLIRVLQTGICGTDLHIYEWDAWAQKTIPVPLVIIIAWLGQIYGKLIGKPVMINRLRQAEFLSRHWVCDTARLRTDLDFKSKWNLLDGLKATVAWYGREGWL